MLPGSVGRVALVSRRQTLAEPVAPREQGPAYSLDEPAWTRKGFRTLCFVLVRFGFVGGRTIGVLIRGGDVENKESWPLALCPPSWSRTASRHGQAAGFGPAKIFGFVDRLWFIAPLVHAAYL